MTLDFTLRQCFNLLMRFTLIKIVGFLIISCLSISSALAVNSQISQMVLLQDEQSTKALITLSQTTNYKAFLLHSPHRAVIDIEAADLGQDFKLPHSNGVVLSVRQGNTPTGIRLVLDLAQSAGLNYSMDNSPSGTPRIVVVLKHVTDAKAQNILLGEQSKPGLPVATPDKPVDSSLLAATVTDIKTVKAVSSMPIAPQKAAGNALLDDEIVQIDIDSSADSSKTTVQKPDIKPAVVAPTTISNPKKNIPPSAAVANPNKKVKTVDDVLGSSARKLIIAIDAGHGGKDSGALGKGGTQEKDITLRVAKELAAIINSDPGMKAVLIRDGDVFVPLQERYMKARRSQADLFVSIHADAALNNEASGSSIYVLSTKGASSQAARWLADKENAADLVGGVTLDNKDKNLSAVLLDLSQSATMRMSEDSADIVLKSLKDLGKTHKKQVEHANFVVLRSPDVPSMLVETGFITNAQEERNLNDAEHRKKLAYAISQGVRNFFIEQPLPGTFYAKKSKGQGAGIAASSGIIP
jgi:N-acetylmuramoyl-L-alanine amidase